MPLRILLGLDPGLTSPNLEALSLGSEGMARWILGCVLLGEVKTSAFLD